VLPGTAVATIARRSNQFQNSSVPASSGSVMTSAVEPTVDAVGSTTAAGSPIAH